MNEHSPMTSTIGEALGVESSPYDDRTGVPHLAWSVWQVMRKQSAVVRQYNATDGMLFEGKMSRILWDVAPTSTKEEHRDISNYLRSTNNAHCLRPRGAAGPLWWVRTTWRDAQSIPNVDTNGRYRETYAERRLSRADAGENMTAAPVAVRYANGTTDNVLPVETVEPVDTWELDPRWFDELVYTVSVSGPDGSITRIMKFVADATGEFTTEDLRYATGLSSMAAAGTLNTLLDSGILKSTTDTAVPRHGGNVRNVWSFVGEHQMVALERVMSMAQTVPRLNRDVSVADTIRDALTTEFETPRELARRLFIARGSVISTLQGLHRRGDIERNKKNGQNVRYRRRRPLTHPVAEPKPSKIPADAPPVNVPVVSSVSSTVQNADVGTGASASSDTDVLAQLLEEVIERRLKDLMQSERTALARVTQERDALRLENDSLRERWNRVKEMLET